MKDSVDNTGTSGNIVYCQRGDGVILVNFDGVAVLYKNTMENPGEARPVQIRSSLEDKSKFYLDTLNLTISADGADSASYVASTGESGTIKGDTKIEIGKGAAVGDTVTLKVTATSGRGTYEKTFTYCKEDLDIDQCIFFKPNSGYHWTKANAYIYAESSKVVTDTYSGWFGVPMFEYDVDADGNTIYAVQVDNIEKYNMVNFNNNVSELQTSLGSYGQLFDADKGSWSQYMEPGSGKAKVTASVDSGIIRNEKQVTFTVTNADSAVYSVDGGEAKSFTDSVTLTVGKDLAEGESTTVTITATKGDKVTEKKFTYTMGENKPDLHISQSTGTVFKDSLEVTLTADNVVEASYQVDDNPAQTFTGSKTITLGENSNAGDMITVTVSGKSSNGKEAKITASYVKTGNTQSNCIYFKNSGNWGTVTAYMWNDSTGKNNGAWPGVAMKAFDADQNIYMIEVPEDADYKNVIFSNSGNSQTSDIALGTLGQLYDYGTGVWSDYQVGTKPTITSTLASGSIDGVTEVTYTVENGETATVKAGFEKETPFTDKVTIKVGEGLKKGETQTVVVKAINGDCVTVSAYTYEMNGQGEKPTDTPTPTISGKPSDTPTPVISDEPTPIISDEPTPVISDEPTPAISNEPTPAISGKPSDTPIPVISDAPSETPVPTVTTAPEETPAPTVTEKPDNTPVPVISNAPSETPAPTVTGEPENTPVPVVSEKPSETPTPTVAGEPEDTPTPTVAEEPEDTPTPTVTTKPIEVTNTPVPTKAPEADQKDIANQKIVMKTSLNYNGKMQLPKVTIKGLTNGVDYQVYYLGASKNVGTYQVEIAGMGDYHGSVIKTYRIEIYKNKTYTVGNYRYKVTNATKGKGQVTVTGARKSTLTSVTIKDTVKIGGVSFKITAIGSNAFANQKKLKSVTIGSNVKKIGSKAFYKDSSLKKITIKSTQLTSVGSNAIKNINKKAVIKVPASQKKKYKKLFKSSTGYKKTMSIK